MTGHRPATLVTHPDWAGTGPTAVLSPYTAIGGPPPVAVVVLEAQMVTWPPGLPWCVTCIWLLPPNTNSAPVPSVVPPGVGFTQASGQVDVLGFAVRTVPLLGVPATT